MYCSSCGGDVSHGLSYCNHCGARLGEAKGQSLSQSSALRPASVIWGMVAVFVFGLAAIMSLMSTMKRLDLATGQILAITLLSFFVMLLLEGVFIWLLVGRGRDGEAGGAATSKRQPTKELDAVQPRVLPEPLPSVTEHTTRTFEPLYKERKSE